MNSVRSHLHVPTHTSTYLGVLSSPVQKFIWRVNSMPMLQQMFSYPFANNSFATSYVLNWVSIRRNPFYYKVFGTKIFSVGDAQKHLSVASAKQRSRWNISQKILEHNEKLTFRNISLWTIQPIQIWEICLIVYMTYFVFRVFANSILVISYSIIFILRFFK